MNMMRGGLRKGRGIAAAFFLVFVGFPAWGADVWKEDFEGPSAVDKWSGQYMTEGEGDVGTWRWQGAAKWTEPFTIALSQVNPHSGANCVEWNIHQECARPSLRSAQVTVPPGTKRVVWKLWVRAEGPAPEGRLSIFQFDGANAWQRAAEQTPQETAYPAAEWTEMSGEQVLNEGIHSVLLSFLFEAAASPVKVYVDDFSVEFLPE